VVVESEVVGEETKIILTIKGDDYGKNLTYDDVSKGTAFTVKFSGDVLEQDLHFDWILIK
jgi:hypothetical protein